MNGYGYPRKSSGGFLFPVLFLIFGAYFINYSLKFIPIPAAVDPVHKWIILGGGILIIIGAINQLRLNSYTRQRYY